MRKYIRGHGICDTRTDELVGYTKNDAFKNSLYRNAKGNFYEVRHNVPHNDFLGFSVLHEYEAKQFAKEYLSRAVVETVFVEVEVT
jgi:hypothetical protein